jgi:hypothetical protein
MKKIVLLLLLTISTLGGYAQTTVIEDTMPVIRTDHTGTAQLVFVLPVAGSQDALFLKAQQWLRHTYGVGPPGAPGEDTAAGPLTVKAHTQTLTRKAGPARGQDAGNFSY